MEEKKKGEKRDKKGEKEKKAVKIDTVKTKLVQNSSQNLQMSKKSSNFAAAKVLELESLELIKTRSLELIETGSLELIETESLELTKK